MAHPWSPFPESFVRTLPCNRPKNRARWHHWTRTSNFSAGVRFGREIVGMVDRAERGLNGFNYRYEGRGAGVGRDLGAGVPLGVGVGLGVELGVGVGDGVLDGVDVAIGVDVGVAVELAVAVGLGVGVGDGVAVGVRVGVGVGP